MSSIKASVRGTVTAELDIDPAEYAGMTPAEISYELAEVLSSIDPSVNFWDDDDIEDLATEIHEAVGATE